MRDGTSGELLSAQDLGPGTRRDFSAGGAWAPHPHVNEDRAEKSAKRPLGLSAADDISLFAPDASLGEALACLDSLAEAEM